MHPTLRPRQWIDIKAIKTYKGDITTKSIAEQFLFEILKIPRLKERLECMMIRKKIVEFYEDL